MKGIFPILVGVKMAHNTYDYIAEHIDPLLDKLCREETLPNNSDDLESWCQDKTFLAECPSGGHSLMEGKDLPEGSVLKRGDHLLTSEVQEILEELKDFHVELAWVRKRHEKLLECLEKATDEAIQQRAERFPEWAAAMEVQKKRVEKKALRHHKRFQEEQDARKKAREESK